MRKTPRLLYATLAAARRPAANIPDVSTVDAAMLGRLARRSLEQGLLEEERWRRFARRASELASDMSIFETARLAGAFSGARFYDFDLYTQFSDRVLDQLQVPSDKRPRVEAGDLQRLVTAFGKVRTFDTDLMEALVPVIIDQVEDFTPRELTRIVDAYSRMAVQNPDLFAMAADALPSYLCELQPVELVALCRAFPDAAVYNEELTDALCAEVQRCLKGFGASECLVFLEGLSRLHGGLEDDMRRDDSAVVAAVAQQLSRSIGVLSASDLIRVFGALVRLNHYDQGLVHRQICSTIWQKLDQLKGPGLFANLAELLHCLSLLPSQSHKSAELALAVSEALLYMGPPPGLPEPRSVAAATAALAQLGQEEEQLLSMLGAMVYSASGPGSANVAEQPQRNAAPPLIGVASDEELLDLARAFGAVHSDVVAPTLAAIFAELKERGISLDPSEAHNYS